MAIRPETDVSKAYQRYIRFAQFHRFSVAFVSVYRSRRPIISIPVKRRALSSRIYGVSLPALPSLSCGSLELPLHLCAIEIPSVKTVDLNVCVFQLLLLFIISALQE